MKTLIKHILAFFVRCSLWFRYKVTIKGLDKINAETLRKPGGILFLPNHPAIFVDPSLVTLALWPRFPIRPLIVEYMYYLPGVNWLMRYLDALPIPNFVTTSNSLKKRKSEQMIESVITGLRNGENFLIYPAGKTKQTGIEFLGGASGVPQILNAAPEANVVLVRTKGLWGSMFSRAITGGPPPMFPTILRGVKYVLKNLLLFTPRRKVTIEFEVAPIDFPQSGSRIEINRWLENYYNKPDGLSKQKDDHPGDSLIFVSYSAWKSDLPVMKTLEFKQDKVIDVETIPPAIQNKVIAKLSALSEVAPEGIHSEMTLSQDLGMDSLSIAEVAIFLQDDFDIKGVPITELTSVGKVMGIASRQLVYVEEEEEEHPDLKAWNKPQPPRERAKIAPGDTIPEVFLNLCDRYGDRVACTDLRSGTMTYKQIKLRALLLANYFKTLPGDYIGILLPSSAGATLLILAIQLAGKIPLMVNWTVGPRHLESVAKLSNVQVVLSSWKFLDKLENVNLDGIEENLVMLEDLRPRLGAKEKLKAFWMSLQKAPTLLKTLNLDKQSKDDPCVLLFTSGTESMPKGVPLSHDNILSNQRSILEVIEIFTDDILLAMLPPFHSFGFTITSLIGILSGFRVAYSPDPTDGKRIAKAIERWGATVMGGTPTFIRSIMKATTAEKLRTARFAFTGAEKAPAELFQLMTEYGKKIDFLLEGYGITECSPVLSFTRMGEPHVGVGRAAPGVELLIVHQEKMTPMPQGEQGLILARGPNVFKGYLNPGLASPFVEVRGKSWYKTGDLGWLDPQGNLTISGRLKRFIKIGAEMISLAAVEDGLSELARKRGWKGEEGATIAVCAKENGDKPKIFVFTTMPLTLDDANKGLREAGFSNLVKVWQVMHLIEIPIMGTGKIDYRLLDTEYVPKLDAQKEKKQSWLKWW